MSSGAELLLRKNKGLGSIFCPKRKIIFFIQYFPFPKERQGFCVALAFLELAVKTRLGLKARTIKPSAI